MLLEHERLRQAFLAALERLIVLLEQEGNYSTAIGYAQQLLRHDPLHEATYSYAQQLLRHDPLHEATYQHLMRLHALSGDRASAVRAY